MIRTRYKSNSPFKGKVSKQASTEVEAHKATGQWLQRSINFNKGLSISPECKKVTDEIFETLQIEGRKIEQKKIDFAVLIANLLMAKKKPLHVSRDRNSWTKSRYCDTSPFMLTLMDELESKGYLKMEKGYQFPDKGQARMTRLWMTPALIKLFPKLPSEVVIQHKECVILRDDYGKDLEYRDTAETHRIRTVLEKANKVTSKADIRYRKYKVSAMLRAIYVNKFTLYGRLHTTGYRHVQALTGDERRELTINGVSVTELDFRALHPCLLYAAEGIQYNEDPYTVITEDLSLRPVLKMALLCMLNCDSQAEAIKAIRYWAYQHDIEPFGNIAELVSLFETKHKPIRKYFYSGKETGLRIMNLDAKIALDVVNHFAKKNVTILPVHDSFIVQKTYADELSRVMKMVYRKHTGFDIMIK